MEKICHLTKSHGKIVAIFSRKCQHIVGKNVHYNGWNTTCILDYQAIVELTFLYENLDFYNGRKIFKSRNFKVPARLWKNTKNGFNVTQHVFIGLIDSCPFSKRP